VTVRHVRTAPFRNTFSYASSMWLVDVDDTDLPSLARPLRALARFKARDHLGDPRRSLRQNIEHYLAGNGIDLAGGRVLLLTSPRSLGPTRGDVRGAAQGHEEALVAGRQSLQPRHVVADQDAVAGGCCSGRPAEADAWQPPIR